MTCWKCGEPTTEGQSECAKCLNVTVTHSQNISTRKIDWGKVTTLEDMKRIMAVFGMQVVTGSVAEDVLRDFLED